MNLEELEKRIDELERRVDNNATVLRQLVNDVKSVAEAVLEIANRITS